MQYVMSDCVAEFTRLHCDIAGSRWHGACFVSWAADQQFRVIATDTINYLSDLKQTQTARATGMVDACQVIGQDLFE